MIDETGLWSMLNKLRAKGVIDILGDELSPPTPSRKEEVAQLVPHFMPDSLKTLLAAAHGAYVGSANLFTLDELKDVHYSQNHLFTYLPSVIFFASDGGDGFFFIDPDGNLGQGKEAIFWVYRGSTVPNDSVLCGINLETFLTSLARGEERWKSPTLEQVAIAEMLERLDSQQNQWSGEKGASMADILDIANRCQLKLPKCLEKLLRKSNGLVFPQAGVTVWAANAVKRLEISFSNGYQPLALLMGEDKTGHIYAITHRDHPSHVSIGWPCLNGWVVQLASSCSLEQTITLGHLAGVVTKWLEWK